MGFEFMVSRNLDTAFTVRGGRRQYGRIKAVGSALEYEKKAADKNNGSGGQKNRSVPGQVKQHPAGENPGLQYQEHDNLEISEFFSRIFRGYGVQEQKTLNHPETAVEKSVNAAGQKDEHIAVIQKKQTDKQPFTQKR